MSRFFHGAAVEAETAPAKAAQARASGLDAFWAGVKSQLVASWRRSGGKRKVELSVCTHPERAPFLQLRSFHKVDSGEMVPSSGGGITVSWHELADIEAAIAACRRAAKGREGG